MCTVVSILVALRSQEQSHGDSKDQDPDHDPLDEVQRPGWRRAETRNAEPQKQGKNDCSNLREYSQSSRREELFWHTKGSKSGNGCDQR